jgi:RimJ/RimL family protein N-acetyltransferase
VRLEPLGKAHESLTFSWLLDPVLREMFYLRGEPDWAMHQAYFDRVLCDQSQCLFAIVHDGQHVGNCGLKHIDQESGSAEMWIYVGSPQTRGSGIGGAATRQLLEFSFQQLGLSLISLHVAKKNIAALHIYQKNGFVEAAQPGAAWQGREDEVIGMTLRRTLP